MQQFPIRRQKYAHIFRAKKYLALECQEVWDSSYFYRKGWRVARAKTAMVFAVWDYELTDQIELRASKSRGSGHSG